MIDLIFYLGTQIVFVRVRGATIMFASSLQGKVWSPIDGLKLSYEGVLKEFPELKDNGDWKAIAIQKFKDKISGLKDEDEVADYVITDLKKHGYIAKYKQKMGFRRVAL